MVHYHRIGPGAGHEMDAKGSATNLAGDAVVQTRILVEAWDDTWGVFAVYSDSYRMAFNPFELAIQANKHVVRKAAFAFIVKNSHSLDKLREKF